MGIKFLSEWGLQTLAVVSETKEKTYFIPTAT